MKGIEACCVALVRKLNIDFVITMPIFRTNPPLGCIPFRRECGELVGVTPETLQGYLILSIAARPQRARVTWPLQKQYFIRIP